MAYALVKAGTVANGTTSVSPAFGQTTGAGNLLIACVCDLNGGVISTTASGWVGVTSGGSNINDIFYKPNSAASETAPVFTSSAATSMNAALFEFSGGATSSPLDQVQGFLGGFGVTPITTNMPAADVAAGELLVCCRGDLMTKSSTATTTDTFNNGATPTTNLNNDASSATQHYRFSWGTTTSNAVADQEISTNSSMNLQDISGVIASFKLPGAVFAQPCNFASGAMLAKRIAHTWQNRRRSGILVPDLWLPGPLAVPAAV